MKRNKTASADTKMRTKWFSTLPYRTSRAALESLSFPFDTSGIPDKTMQAIVDEARAEAEADPEGFIFQAAVRDAAIRHGIPFKHKSSGWRTTDKSCNQRCRIHTVGDGRTLAYEYEQDTPAGKAHALISVHDYDFRSEKFAADYLAPYGYKNIRQVRAVYGIAWEQIVAECIFETDMEEFVE